MSSGHPKSVWGTAEDYRLILDTVPMPIAIVDRSHRYEYTNAQYRDWFGGRRRRTRGRLMREVVGEAAYAAMCPYLERAFSGEVVQFEHVYFLADGSSRNVEVNLVARCDGDRRVVSVCILAVDVTKRRRAEEAVAKLNADLQRLVSARTAELTATNVSLRGSEERFRQLAENIDGVVWLSDIELGEMLYVSPVYERIFARSCESLYQNPRSLVEAIHPQDRQRLIASLPRRMQESCEGEFRLVRPDQSTRWIRVRAFPIGDAEGHACRIAGIAEDVTERKRATESVKRMAAIVEFSNDAIIGTSLDGIITSWNAAAERIYGYARFEAVGQPLDFLSPQPSAEDVLHILDRVRQGICVEHLETKRRHKSGRIVDVSLTASPIRDDDGAVNGAAIIDRDISERKSLHADLVRIAEDEQRRIGQDLHDGLGQELTGVGLLAETLAHSLQRKSLPEAQAARRLSQVLGDLLDRVRNLSRGIVPVDVDSHGLTTALHDLAASIHELHGVTCRFHHDGEIQVFDNFVATHLFRIAQEATTNALKHSRADEIRISLTRESAQLRLDVSDNGVGMRQAIQETSGMGLRIMRYRAELIGADWKLRTSDGGGTTISCQLPLKRRLAQATPSQPRLPRS